MANDLTVPLSASAASVSLRFSERALDATTFFLADVADGLGPFLAIYLTTARGWSAGEAGLAMAMLLVATVASQTFTGAWIDGTRHKRRAITLAALVVAGVSVALYYASGRLQVYLLQAAIGIAVTVFPPAIAAISLGLVGRSRLAARAGRNEACFHAGNVASAGLAMGANWCWGPAGIFYGVAAMAVASALSAQLIAESSIDHRLARGADNGDATPAIIPLASLLWRKNVLWFIAAVVLFHFANAAMLPLVGQKVGRHSPASASALMAMCIIVAQIAMVPVALVASRLAKSGRRAVFLVGFAVLPLRGWLYTLTDSTTGLIAIQILDGIGAGIFGVTAVLMTADLTRGTGRFNFLQGVIATAIGLGAAASNALTGIIADRFGYNTGFTFLAAMALLALVLFYLAVPESLDQPDRIEQKLLTNY